MNKKLVSIIITTYNGERFIARTLESVLNQTYKNLEVIVVDDASTDNTPKIVKKFQKKAKERDIKLKLIRLRKNTGGPAIPRNIGIKNAKGEFIAILDHDDIFYPENISKKVEILESHPEINIVTGYQWTIDENGEIIDYWSDGTLNWLCRKEIFKFNKFKKSQNFIDEIGFILRYIRHYGTKSIYTIYEPMTLYSKHSAQFSNLFKVGSKEYIKRLNSIIEEAENWSDKRFTKILADLYWRLGNFYCIDGQIVKGRKYFIKSFLTKPNIPSILLFLLSFLSLFIDYKIIDKSLRYTFWRRLGKLRVLINKLKYKESYEKAKEIIRKYFNQKPQHL